jgi:hypothetical protein
MKRFQWKWIFTGYLVTNFSQIGGFLYFGGHFGLKMATIANRNGRNMVQHVLLPVNIHLIVFGFLSSNFMKLCRNIHRSVWQLLGVEKNSKWQPLPW